MGPRPSLGLRLAARLSRPWRAARLADPSRGYRHRTARAFLPIAGAAGPALVQDVVVRQHTASTSISIAVAVTATGAGNCLVLIVTIAAGAAVTADSVTDTAGNAWTRLGYDTTVNPSLAVYIAPNAASITSVTWAATYTSTGINIECEFLEVSGVVAATPSYGLTYNPQTAKVTSESTASLTPTAVNDFVIAYGVFGGAAQAITTTGTGWTALTGETANGPITAGGYRIAADTTTALSDSWSVATAEYANALIVALKAAASTTPEAVTGAPIGVGVDTGAPILGESGTAVGVGEVTSPSEGIGDTGTAVAVGEATSPDVGAGAAGAPIGVGEVAGTPTVAVGAMGQVTGVGEVGAASEGIGDTGAPTGVGVDTGTPTVGGGGSVPAAGPFGGPGMVLMST